MLYAPQNVRVFLHILSRLEETFQCHFTSEYRVCILRVLVILQQRFTCIFDTLVSDLDKLEILQHPGLPVPRFFLVPNSRLRDWAYVLISLSEKI